MNEMLSPNGDLGKQKCYKLMEKVAVTEIHGLLTNLNTEKLMIMLGETRKDFGSTMTNQVQYKCVTSCTEK